MASSAFHEAAQASSEATPLLCRFQANTAVLLIQDVVPWFAPPDQDPLGAVVTELKARKIKFDLVPSNLIGVIALNKYKGIIIPSAQTQPYYNNLFPDGYLHFALVNWVERGGALLANLADHASGPARGGNWDDRVFLDGITKVVSFADQGAIAQPHSPVITGKLGGKNGGQIVDDGPLQDLDDWNFSSHGYFSNLTPRAKVVLAEQADLPRQRPVTIQLKFGRGKAIASMTTTEWRYAGGTGSLPQNKKLLANLIGYWRHLLA